MPARPVTPQRSFSPEAQELRALLRRVPDGFQATLKALKARPEEARERVMAELARGVGKDVLPLFRSAALGADEGLALSALRVLPVFGSRAAGDVLVEVHEGRADTERAQLAAAGVRALQARGIGVSLGNEAPPVTEARLTLRETFVSAPDGVGSRSVTARLQDQYGVWHAIFVLWNDQAGIRDGFLRQMSRNEWDERRERADERGLGWVPCPPEYARWQVARGLAVSAGLGEDVAAQVADFQREVGPDPEGYEPPAPWGALPALDSEEGAELVQEVGCLIHHTEARRWSLEVADLADWGPRLAALTAENAEATLPALVDEALPLLLPESLAALYGGRLLDLARVCAWRGDQPHARLAAASAAALAAGRPPAEVPFCRRLVESTLLLADALLRRGDDLEKHRWRPKRFAPKRG